MITEHLQQALEYAKTLTPQELFNATGDARGGFSMKDARIQNPLVWEAMKLQNAEQQAELLIEKCGGSASTVLEVEQLCYDLHDAINAFKVTVSAA